MVAESLSPNLKLDRLILIAAALSPDYDLSPAVSRCNKGLVSFYSKRDWWTLGMGTSLFGTIDRKYTASAGQLGFRSSKGKVIKSDLITQIPWRPDWLKLGHDGGHVGWLKQAWSREILAPQIDPSLSGDNLQKAM